MTQTLSYFRQTRQASRFKLWKTGEPHLTRPLLPKERRGENKKRLNGTKDRLGISYDPLLLSSLKGGEEKTKRD
jgi:hypothetical protein